MRGAAWLIGHKETGRVFQSTLPMRGAAEPVTKLVEEYEISIHAPHAGSGDRPA